MKYKINKESIKQFNGSDKYNFPKYTSQLINWANQNAQGTRPRIVGQMSEIFPEFVKNAEQVTFECWESYYLAKYPHAIDDATDKIYKYVEYLREAIQLIDRDMVNHWVEDLVFSKTFNGMYFQKAILASLAQRNETTYRLATPDEEAKGIDGYVGAVAYSVKPDTYKTMGRLPEVIDVKKIYYTKTDSGLIIEVEE